MELVVEVDSLLMAEDFRGNVEGQIIFGPGSEVHCFLEDFFPFVGLEEGEELSECPSDALQTLIEVQLKELDVVDLLLQLFRTQALQVSLDLIDKVRERVNSKI